MRHRVIGDPGTDAPDETHETSSNNTACRGALRRAARVRRIRLIPVLGLLAVLGLVIAVSLPSCRLPTCPNPSIGGPGVPTIRVRLSPRPIEMATLSAGGGYRLTVADRCLAEGSGDLPPTIVRRTGQTWQVGALTADGADLVLDCGSCGCVRLGADAYRGRLHLVPAGDGGFFPVNYVDMEGYVAGVLPRELHANWSEETYKALAVAARTFARYQMVTFGPSHFYDVNDDQSSQVYGGVSAETDKSRRAVNATRGMILTCVQNGRQGIFLAQYSACCGGVVNDAQVLRDTPALSPLMGGQRCDDCQGCPKYSWPTVKISRAEVARAIAMAYPAEADRVGAAVVDIRVATATAYGRAIFLDVVGAAGSTRLRADDLRLALMRAHIPAAAGLYSMNCKITCEGNYVLFSEGRGFGHGVGLCQWGAEGKAQRGWNAQRILNYYYPGAKIFVEY